MLDPAASGLRCARKEMVMWLLAFGRAKAVAARARVAMRAEVCMVVWRESQCVARIGFGWEPEYLRCGGMFRSIDVW